MMQAQLLKRKSGAIYQTVKAVEYGRCTGCAFFKGKRKSCRRDAREICHNDDVIWERS
jgi:hypothetical protein